MSSPMGSSPACGVSVLPDDFFTSAEVEPVGRWFLSHWDRLHAHRGMSSSGAGAGSDEEDGADSASSSSEEEEEDVEFEDDLEYLRSLDPKECKEQDHYRVLGIPRLRIRATEEQIRKAYRFKVLRHHPDKRRAAGEDIREDDDYFTCITRAFETLGAPAKRRSYDSVDPEFDDDLPELKKGVSEAEFLAAYGPAFERNARWSVKKHVPKLGDERYKKNTV